MSLAFGAGHRDALLGYGIHEQHRGVGLTGEAVEAVLSEAFETHPQLEKLTAKTDARNRSSSRLLEKLGFTRDDTPLSSGVNSKGESVDGASYTLARPER